MANDIVRITELPGANPLSGIELVPMVQSGVTVTRSVQDIVSEGGLQAHIDAPDPHPQYAFRVKNNLEATTDPTVNDDSTQGYEPTSRWVNTVTEEFFICVTNTTGAANWQTLTLTLDELGSAALADVGTAPAELPTNQTADNKYLQKTDNLASVSNAQTSFDNIKQSATETYEGVVEVASNAEALAGTVGKFPDAADVHAAFNQYGLGASSAPYTQGSVDSLTETAFYEVSTAEAIADNLPGSTGGVLMVYGGPNNSYTVQEYSVLVGPTPLKAIRHQDNGVWRSWQTVYHSGNDGVGSSLDADLLDGQHGSFYQNASNLNAGTINDARLPATISSDITGTAANAELLDNLNSTDFFRDRSLNTLGTGDDLDTIVDTGVYGWNLNAPANAPSNYCTMIVTNDGSQSIQLVFGSTVGAAWIRRANSGTYGGFVRFYDQNYHPEADTLTTARTIALGGDLSGSVNFDGSSNVTITATVADDSHNHVIANVDGLQAALDQKLGVSSKAADSDLFDGLNSTQFVRSDANDTKTGDLRLSNGAGVDLNEHFRFNAVNSGLGWGIQEISSTGNLSFDTRADSGAWTQRVSISASGAISATAFVGSGSSLTNLNASSLSSGTVPDARLPNTITSDITGNAATATRLATARTIALGGDVSGSASFNGSSNITITATVADDSHNHVISNVDGLQGVLDDKLSNIYLTNRQLSDANNTDVEGVMAHYLTTSAANKPTGTDHALFSLSYDNRYTFQMAGDWRTNDLYLRQQENTVWGSWAKVWTNQNDGSGSGLDADTLDGIDSAAFLRSNTADTMLAKLTFSGGFGSSGNGMMEFNSNNFTGSSNQGPHFFGKEAGTTLWWIGSFDNATYGTNLVLNAVNGMLLRTGNSTSISISSTGNTTFNGSVITPDGTVGSNATRDAIIQTTEPTSGQGVNGDICYVYTP